MQRSISESPNILIVQEVLEHYREPLFERLCTPRTYKIFAFIDRGRSPDLQAPNFATIRGKSFRFLGLSYQWGFWGRVLRKEIALVVAAFNPRIISNVLLLALCRTIGVKFVWWGIGFGTNRAMDKLRVWFAGCADAVLLYECGAAIKMVSMGVNREKLFVLHNTVDVKIPVSFSASDRRKNFLFIGTLNRRKEVEVLIAAFYKAIQLMPTDICLDIIGDGPDRLVLENCVADLGISNRVFFYGKLTREELLRPFFETALLSISPGQAGLSILESFGHGVGFVTKSNAISGGEVENITHSKTGFFFDGSVAGLATILVEVSNDKEIAIKVSRNCLDHYTKHRTMDMMAERYLGAIHYALAGESCLSWDCD